MAKYTKEEKQKAIDLYIRYCKQTTKVIKELGYPNERHTLVSWYRGYEEKGEVKDDGREEKKLSHIYSEEQVHAAEWFHSKWGVPTSSYLECMEAYLSKETEYGWYLCLACDKIVGGMGVIENDFHSRANLSPNICAVYTDKDFRIKGVARHLLDMTVEDMRTKGISPIYLVTDHIGLYEKYGWDFLCMVKSEGETKLSRMYIHR